MKEFILSNKYLFFTNLLVSIFDSLMISHYEVNRRNKVQIAVEVIYIQLLIYKITRQGGQKSTQGKEARGTIKNKTKNNTNYCDMLL